MEFEKFLNNVRTLHACSVADSAQCHQPICNDYMYRIEEALKYAKILHVNLSGCSITDCGAEALARALVVNTTLKSLNLEGNCISRLGATRLAEALATKNCTLTSLDLSGNPCVDEAADIMNSIACAVNRNQMLEQPTTRNSFHFHPSSAYVDERHAYTHLQYNEIDNDDGLDHMEHRLQRLELKQESVFDQLDELQQLVVQFETWKVQVDLASSQVASVLGAMGHDNTMSKFHTAELQGLMENVQTNFGAQLACVSGEVVGLREQLEAVRSGLDTLEGKYSALMEASQTLGQSNTSSPSTEEEARCTPLLSSGSVAPSPVAEPNRGDTQERSVFSGTAGFGGNNTRRMKPLVSHPLSFTSEMSSPSISPFTSPLSTPKGGLRNTIFSRPEPSRSTASQPQVSTSAEKEPSFVRELQHQLQLQVADRNRLAEKIQAQQRRLCSVERELQKLRHRFAEIQPILHWQISNMANQDNNSSQQGSPSDRHAAMTTPRGHSPARASPFASPASLREPLTMRELVLRPAADHEARSPLASVALPEESQDSYEESQGSYEESQDSHHMAEDAQGSHGDSHGLDDLPEETRDEAWHQGIGLPSAPEVGMRVGGDALGKSDVESVSCGQEDVPRGDVDGAGNGTDKGDTRSLRHAISAPAAPSPAIPMVHPLAVDRMPVNLASCATSDPPARSQSTQAHGSDTTVHNAGTPDGTDGVRPSMATDTVDGPLESREGADGLRHCMPRGTAASNQSPAGGLGHTDTAGNHNPGMTEPINGEPEPVPDHRQAGARRHPRPTPPHMPPHDKHLLESCNGAESAHRSMLVQNDTHDGGPPLEFVEVDHRAGSERTRLVGGVFPDVHEDDNDADWWQNGSPAREEEPVEHVMHRRDVSIEQRDALRMASEAARGTDSGQEETAGDMQNRVADDEGAVLGAMKVNGQPPGTPKDDGGAPAAGFAAGVQCFQDGQQPSSKLPPWKASLKTPISSDSTPAPPSSVTSISTPPPPPLDEDPDELFHQLIQAADADTGDELSESTWNIGSAWLVDPASCSATPRTSGDGTPPDSRQGQQSSQSVQRGNWSGVVKNDALHGQQSTARDTNLSGPSNPPALQPIRIKATAIEQLPPAPSSPSATHKPTPNRTHQSPHSNSTAIQATSATAIPSPTSTHRTRAHSTVILPASPTAIPSPAFRRKRHTTTSVPDSTAILSDSVATLMNAMEPNDMQRRHASLGCPPAHQTQFRPEKGQQSNGRTANKFLGFDCFSFGDAEHATCPAAYDKPDGNCSNAASKVVMCGEPQPSEDAYQSSAAARQSTDDQPDAGDSFASATPFAATRRVKPSPLCQRAASDTGYADAHADAHASGARLQETPPPRPSMERFASTVVNQQTNPSHVPASTPTVVSAALNAISGSKGLTAETASGSATGSKSGSRIPRLRLSISRIPRPGGDYSSPRSQASSDADPTPSRIPSLQKSTTFHSSEAALGRSQSSTPRTAMQRVSRLASCPVVSSTPCDMGDDGDAGAAAHVHLSRDELERRDGSFPGAACNGGDGVRAGGLFQEGGGYQRLLQPKETPADASTAKGDRGNRDPGMAMFQDRIKAFRGE